MKCTLFLVLAVSSCAFAQDVAKTNVMYQSSGTGVVTAGAFIRATAAPVQGAPYSATITNESIQTLADGTHITQTSTGTTARDSQGRTRQDATLPPIGNLSAANAPHLVFIMDPVAQVSYTLNLTDKTAQKIPMPPSGAGVSASAGPAGPATSKMLFVQSGSAVASSDLPAGDLPPLQPGIVMQRAVAVDDQAQASPEDLGTQTMDGVVVTGVRITRTIPEGQIGNDKPISIVTEVWTSPDLKTVVSSMRSDPRMGQHTFKLTNIVRAEPDPSLFTVPADFRITEGPQGVVYRSNQ
jgi:hypothetical protein